MHIIGMNKAQYCTEVNMYVVCLQIGRKSLYHIWSLAKSNLWDTEIQLSPEIGPIDHKFCLSEINTLTTGLL